MEAGAIFCGEFEVGLDGEFGKENSGTRFPYGDHVGGWLERRETLAHFFCGKNLMSQLVLLSAAFCATD